LQCSLYAGAERRVKVRDGAVGVGSFDVESEG